MSRPKEEFFRHAVERLIEDAERSREKLVEYRNAFDAATKMLTHKVTVKGWIAFLIGYGMLLLVVFMLAACIVWSFRWTLEGMGIV